MYVSQGIHISLSTAYSPCLSNLEPTRPIGANWFKWYLHTVVSLKMKWLFFLDHKSRFYGMLTLKFTIWKHNLERVTRLEYLCVLRDTNSTMYPTGGNAQ